MRICNASLLILLLALIAAVPRSQAQQIDLIANTDARQTISLDGQWKTIIDPYESGYYDYRYQPSTNGYFKDAKPKTKSDLIEYERGKRNHQWEESDREGELLQMSRPPQEENCSRDDDHDREPGNKQLRRETACGKGE